MSDQTPATPPEGFDEDRDDEETAADLPVGEDVASEREDEGDSGSAERPGAA